ncbi:MAG: radical SAM protein [Euryarchaeota archaeon]|nr:radical SAM protein [Euryarchaeota archaeon]
MRKPMTFSVLSALTPEKHSVELIEGGLNDINFDEKYDLVGITCVTAYASLAYEIADKFRRRGVPVVLGGYHPSALPEEAKQHADAVVIGEAEETWPQLLNDFEKGQLKPIYIPNRPVDPNLIPSPRELYTKGVGIQATRGCPNKCEFCSITNMKFRDIFRTRPTEVVVKEIQMYTDRIFVFQDDSLTVNPNYTKQLFREIRGLNKKFLAYGNINVLGRDEELLKIASDAGCIGWLIGFESVCQQSLDSIGKKTNKVSEYLAAVKKLHDYGMMIEGSFVFGFDYDTPEVFMKTDEFVRKGEIDLPFALILIPYPGTPIFERFERDGRILTKDWSEYSGEKVVFQPKNMTTEELFTYTFELNKLWRQTPLSIRRILRSLSFGFYPFTETMGIEIYLKLLNLTNKFKMHK